MIREALTLERLRAMDADEVAAVFVARRADGLTASEQGLLADWLAADDAHPLAFEGAERAWETFADAEGDEILVAMRAHARGTQTPFWLNWRRAAAAAAVLILIAASTLLLAPRLSGPTPAPGSGAELQYASARGQVRDIALPDGSNMTLDAESAALVRFDAAERSIRLVHGRAFFEVRRDPTRPFAVTAASRRVIAVGTRFEVDLLPGALSVTLVHGRVTVGPLNGSAQPIVLNPGQKFVERDGARTIRTVGTEGDAVTGWRRGLIDFDDDPLGEAAAEVNRYSRKQLVIRDPAVAALRVSGQFRAGEADRFARTVAEVHPVRVIRRGNEIELAPAG